MPMPLEGIRVLDWTAFQHGPISTCLLADMGAEVIKVEPPEGEPARGMLRIYGVEVPLNFYFQNQNRGKKGIVLNLRLAKGREILCRLVEKSDVFVTNFRESISKRLKLDYGTLRRYNPRLIYAYSSGYGPAGPDADLRSADFAAQARGGLWSVSRGADLSWTPIGAGMADEMGGFVTAYGILLALIARDRYGMGQRVDASLLSGQIELGRLSLQSYLMGVHPAPSTVAQPRSPLYGIYECGDGKWICISVLQADRYWPKFCQVLGIGELEKDWRFEEAAVRCQNIQQLLPKLKEIFKARPRQEWIRLFIKAGVEQVAPVQDYEDVARDPQVLANEYITTVAAPIYEKVRVPGIPVKLSETPGKVRALAPELGQHTEEVLQEILGLTWDELCRLRDEGVY